MKWLLVIALLLALPVGSLNAGERTFRLGELAPSNESLELTRTLTLPELAKLGFEEGRNLVLNERVGGDASTAFRSMRELLQANPDAIVAIGGDAIRAATEATSTVPVVVFGGAPIKEGSPTSLARPGGNVTGVVILAPELDGKRLDLLREAVPGAQRIAALLHRSAANRDISEREMRKVAASAGIELLTFEAGDPKEYPGVFEEMRGAGAQALVITAHANFYRDASAIIQLALSARLPTICEWAEMAQAGCLLGYGPNRPDLRRRLAHHLAHIFKGTAPGDLPIEQPTRYEFAINLKTAKALGITVAPLLLARADEVIE